MITLSTYRITDNVPFQMYLLADNRVKRILKDFDFYSIRFYNEERSKNIQVCFDYPKGNLYWYVDFEKAVRNDILSKDARYEKDWNTFLAKLKATIKTEFDSLKTKLRGIKAIEVLNLMNKYQLHDYQAYDVLQLIIKMNQTPEHPSGLILSEQRTGKTRVALATIDLMLTAGDCAIVVAPKSGIGSWTDEMRKLSGVLDKTVFNIAIIRHTKDLAVLPDPEPDALNVRVISYDLFKRFTYAQLRKLYGGKEFSGRLAFIGDEVHKLRNFKTLQSSAIFQFKEGCLKDKIPLYTIGVTGTPTVKETTDIFGLFCLINYSKISFQPYYKDFNNFKEYFYNCEDTSYGKICKSLKRTDELKFLIQNCAVQTKQRELDLFKNYKRLYKVYKLSMDEMQAGIYDSVEKSMEYGTDIDCVNGLVQLVRLQQICIDPSGLVGSYDLCAPKIKWALGFIQKNRCKGLIMAKKRMPLTHLSKLLDEYKIPYVEINGSVSQEDRNKAVNDFNTNPDIRVALLQLDAGRECLTLPKAMYTLFLDRDWAQGYNDQAEARMTPVDGSTATKYVIDLVMRGTVEENIYDTLVIRKQNIETLNTVFKKSERKEETENGNI